MDYKLRTTSKRSERTMNLRIAQVIGLNTDQKAAQVTSTARDDNTFMAVLEMSCDDAFTKGRQALSELEDFYFEFEGNPTERLNATFAEAENRLPKECEFDLVLATVSGKVLYLIGKGQVEVYLKRGDKFSPLLSVGAPSQIISGFLQDSDRFLLCTGSLSTFLGSELEKSLSLPIEIFEEEVGSKIGTANPDSQGLAALAVETLEENLEIESIASPQSQDAGPVAYQTEEQLAENTVKKTSILIPLILGTFLKLFGRLGSYFPKSGRGRLIAAVVLILVIAAGAGYKYKSTRDAETQRVFNQMLQEARDNFDGAKGIASLSPVDAKSKLDQAQESLNKALVLKPNNQEAQDFKKQLEAEASSILQQAEVSEFPVFLDLDLIKKSFRAEQMSLSNGKLLLLDPGVKTLVVIDLAKKSNQILAGSEKLGEAVFASLNGGTAIVYSKDKGILKIDINNQKITTVAKTDDEWGQIADIYGFAGNVYALDGGKNGIWKYLPAAGGYSSKREYLSKDAEADFSGSLRMQIESSIYILKQGGEILRFTKGDKDNFSLGGLDKGVKDPKSFFVSSDTDDLYLLDSGNSRLVILTKTGSYKGQIAGSKFATSSDLVVDEAGGKVYLLDGSKIYSVDLK